MSALWGFDNTENKHSLCRGEDCMKTFYTFLTEHATKDINFEKKKMLLMSKNTL